MNSMISLLRRTHCLDTHRRFAIDALPLMQTAAGQRLARLLLCYHRRYLTGAVDPDERFRDYQNHVIHVNEGYWGGAPRVTQSWYERLQRYLRTQRWSDAAHAAGVLGHYFTDVLQPLHTMVCPLEQVVHRPLEFSVRKSYQAIHRRWQQDEMRVVFQLSDREEWLGEAMLHSARFAHRKRQLLLDHYDLACFRADPRAALDGHCRGALSELFGLAITGLARILERAADDAEARARDPLPTVSLVLPTGRAIVRAPLAWLTGSLADRRERQEMNALTDEFHRRGALLEHLPGEVDITHRVVEVFHDEQRWKRDRLLRRQRLQSAATVVGVKSAGGALDNQPAPATIPFPPARRSLPDSNESRPRRSA